MEVLRAADLRLVTVPEGHDTAAILRKIRIVAGALQVPRAAARLAREVETAMAEAVAADRAAAPSRVLFILSMPGFAGDSQVSDEDVLTAAPDVILMMDRSGDHAADTAEITAHPAPGRTRAARSGAILRQPGVLMPGFGPRTPEVVQALSAVFRQARG